MIKFRVKDDIDRGQFLNEKLKEYVFWLNRGETSIEAVCLIGYARNIAPSIITNWSEFIEVIR